MKFHWGHGIAAFYGIFALSLITAVIKSTSFDNSLVADDYYAKDIAYQQTMDRRANSKQLPTAVRLEKQAKNYQLQFPLAELDEAVDGTIQLYCPSTANRDLYWPISLDTSGVQTIPTSGLKAGKYKLIVNWSSASKQYLDEFVFYLKD